MARLLDAESAFVRRRVNFDGGERVDDTVDVLAFSFDSALNLRLATGKCETAEAKDAPSTRDRLLWLAGVNRLIRADAGFVATVVDASDADRRFACSLALELVDLRDLARREAIRGIDAEHGYGHYHSPAGLALEREVEAAVGDDAELRRLWRLARGDLWLAEPVLVVKRALDAFRVVAGRWSDELPDADGRVLRWLAGEAIAGFTLASTRLAGESYRVREDLFAEQLIERLPVDACSPRLPEYFEPLLELIQRLADDPWLTWRLPNVEETYLEAAYFDGPLIGSEDPAARLLRLIASFVERHGPLPAALVAPLRRLPERATGA